MSGKDMQIRPCGLWWDYCDGNCTVCGKLQTWATDSSTPMAAEVRGHYDAQDDRNGRQA